ncbi:ATP-binding cassette domain-containing protein [Frankia sp. Cpl3]|uniref:ABC transporter ATP-binding protein n=1 Tax=Parafrankia colletiae TaxID=573497 RepID=UPI000A5C2BC7|nr:ATP-binding cassette domain-containing protein [Parafrankia colletiae]MCK9898488.1 ATP-binding cassette domain-containing protein [Frankia sp. Cpl3]
MSPAPWRRQSRAATVPTPEAAIPASRQAMPRQASATPGTGAATAGPGPGASVPASVPVPVLTARGLSAGYGEGGPAVRDLDLDLCPGEIVTLLGPNGAGKTTTLLALSGALRPRTGVVRWAGRVTTAPLHQRARAGLALVPEDRSVIMELTVRENLRLGAADTDLALETFPELAGHLDRRAGLLSGGQQQMVALARALARRPAALLADELSLGLAPRIAERLLGVVRAAADGGLAVLLVEQHVRSALAVADRVIVLRHGQVAWSGPAEQARADPDVLVGAYLPLA